MATATVALLFSLTGAHAAEHAGGQHPAVLVHARAQGIDANRFIVVPPASTTRPRPHANAEHPAVLMARAAHVGAVDSNTFTVQPPASVTWTTGTGSQLAAQLAPSSSRLR